MDGLKRSLPKRSRFINDVKEVEKKKRRSRGGEKRFPYSIVLSIFALCKPLQWTLSLLRSIDDCM